MAQADNPYDATPSPAQYLNCLNILVTDSTNRSDREWARREREKMVDGGLVSKSAINPIFDKLKEGFSYVAVKGANWD